MAASTSVFALQIRNGEDLVSIDLQSDDFDHVLNLLRSERQPLRMWYDIAMWYYRMRHMHEFRTLIETAIETHSSAGNAHLQDLLPVLYARGADFLMQAMQTTDADQRKKLLDMGHKPFWEALRILRDLPMIEFPAALVGLEFCELLSGNVKKTAAQAPEYPSAESQYLGLLCHAFILFRDGRYDQALETFKKMAVTLENCPSYIRIGAGYCQLALGNVPRAMAAFQQVLVDANGVDAVEAVVGTALCYLFSERSDKKEMALKEIEVAFERNPEHPIVLNLLSDHFFQSGNLQDCVKCALNSYFMSTSKEIQAEAAFQVGRSMHALGDYARAAKYYQLSMSLHEGNVLAKFGRAQVFIRDGRIDQSIADLEGVRQKVGNVPDVLRVLAYTYARKGELDKAHELYMEVVPKFPEDVDLLLDLFMIQVSRGDAKKAEASMGKASLLLQKQHKKVPFAVLNNSACLNFSNHKYSDALALLKLADSDSENPQRSSLAFKFNVARAMEACGHLDEARERYLAIVKSHPYYQAVYYRLSDLCRGQGKKDEGISWIMLATELHPKDKLTLYVLGLAHLQDKNLIAAQQAFQKILKMDEHDILAKLGLGHIYFVQACSETDPSRVEKYLGYATDFFSWGMSSKCDSSYSAVGLSAVLGEKGYLEDAQRIISKVRESQNIHLAGVLTLNSAHIELANKQFGRAISLYESVLEQWDTSPIMGSRTTVILCLARALFDNAEFDRALEVLKEHEGSAGSLAHLYIYDRAVVLLRHSEAILQKEKMYLTVTRATSCLERLKAAKAVIEDNSDILSKYSSSLASRVTALMADIEKGIVRAEEALTRAISMDRVLAQARKAEVLAQPSSSAQTAQPGTGLNPTIAERLRAMREQTLETILTLQKSKAESDVVIADAEADADADVEMKDAVVGSTKKEKTTRRKRKAAEDDGELSEKRKRKSSQKKRATKKSSKNSSSDEEQSEESADDRSSASEEDEKPLSDEQTAARPKKRRRVMEEEEEEEEKEGEGEGEEEEEKEGEGEGGDGKDGGAEADQRDAESVSKRKPKPASLSSASSSSKKAAQKRKHARLESDDEDPEREGGNVDSAVVQAEPIFGESDQDVKAAIDEYFVSHSTTGMTPRAIFEMIKEKFGDDRAVRLKDSMKEYAIQKISEASN
eukprot:ANDGO_04262.mRNA.1 Protein CTR9 homolog